MIGYDTAKALIADCQRLTDLIREAKPMTCLDWRRALISCELLFGSDVLGCGVEWQTVSGLRDEETITALRALERKLAGLVRARV